MESSARRRDAIARETPLHETAFFQCFFSTTPAVVRMSRIISRVERRIRTQPMDARGGLKIFSAKPRISASHNPICADLRKHPTGREAPRHRWREANGQEKTRVVAGAGCCVQLP